MNGDFAGFDKAFEGIALKGFELPILHGIRHNFNEINGLKCKVYL
jgi:hypothetical protein